MGSKNFLIMMLAAHLAIGSVFPGHAGKWAARIVQGYQAQMATDANAGGD